MEKEIRLIWNKRSDQSIAKIYQFIAENNPVNAESFILRLYDFGESLRVFPEKYSPCRFKKFANRGYHCAVFEKNYIFLYRIKGNALYICNVIRTSRLR